MRYDCIVIGLGPAGLEAAITLKVRNKNVLLFGKPSKKVMTTHEIENYLGLKNIVGTDLQDKFLDHAISMGVEIREENINTVYSMGEYFNVQTNKNEFIETSSVIIATGVSMDKLIPGEEEFLGRGVSYCATCDGNFYKGKTISVICYDKVYEEEVEYLSDLASKIYLIPLYKDVSINKENVEIINDKVKEIKGMMKVKSLVLENSNLDIDGLFILRATKMMKSLVPGLEVDDKHIIVNRKMETNIKGLFACGDITGEPYQYIKAAGEGNVAAISVVNYLNKRK